MPQGRSLWQRRQQQRPGPNLARARALTNGSNTCSYTEQPFRLPQLARVRALTNSNSSSRE